MHLSAKVHSNGDKVNSELKEKLTKLAFFRSLDFIFLQLLLGKLVIPERLERPTYCLEGNSPNFGMRDSLLLLKFRM